MKLPNWAKVPIVLIVLIVTFGLLVTAQPAKAQDSNVVISRIHYNAGGNDWNNPNDEYVVLSNGTAETLDLSGWTLSDEANHVFSFPNGFDLPENGSVTIYSGSGTNTESKLYWGNGAIWNNGGDVAYLKDSAGGVVDRVEYSGGGTEWVRGVEEAKSLPGSLPEKVTVKITEVVDGDTMDIRLPFGAENTVRILGVDTPEIYHKNEAGEYDNIDNLSYLKKWGYKAKSYVENLVEDKKVTLVFDKLAGRVGYYGRWLGYITFDNKNLSYLLVKNGYARVYTEGNCRWEDNLVKSQKVAVNNYVGLWEIAKLKLRSGAFKDGENIPVKYTADGKNISPPLTIKNIPDQAKSLALVVVDLDAPGGKFTHWIMWNMPADIRTVSENVQKEKVVGELGGAKQGKNDFGEIGYGGPSPPEGSSHRYRFTVYALDKELELSAGATKGQLMDRLENHILQKSELVGVYKRAEEGGEGLPWALIGGIIVAVIAISAFALYKRK